MAKRLFRPQANIIQPDQLYDDHPLPLVSSVPHPVRLKHKFRSVLPDVAEISDQEAISSIASKSYRKPNLLKSKPRVEDRARHSSSDLSEKCLSSFSVSETDDHNGDDESDSRHSSDIRPMSAETVEKASYNSYLKKYKILKRALEQLTSMINNQSVKTGGKSSNKEKFLRTSHSAYHASVTDPEDCFASGTDETRKRGQIFSRPATSLSVCRTEKHAVSLLKTSRGVLPSPGIKRPRPAAKSLPNLIDSDASSSNEAAHLQQRLKNLSSELDTLRNRLHVNGGPQGLNGTASRQQSGVNGGNPPNLNAVNSNSSIPPGVLPPRLPPVPHLRGCPSQGSTNGSNQPNAPQPLSHALHSTLSSGGVGSGESYTYKPLPPHPPVLNNSSVTRSKFICPANPPPPSADNNHHQNSDDTNPDPTSSNISNSVIHNNHHNSVSHQNANNSYYVNQSFPKDVMRSNGEGPNGDLHIVGSSEDKAPGSFIGTGTTNSATSGNDGTASEASFKLMTSSVRSTTSAVAPSHPKVNLAEIEDLIHLHGPLTEDALMRCLQARYAASKYYVHMGPILLVANPYTSVGNALTLNSTKGHYSPPPIQKIIQEALRQQGDTGYPQAIILSGCSGSGKTYTSMLVLRQLFELAGGGSETDAFKHLVASITVLRSLGTARTVSNSESSRIGHFIEVQVTEGTVYRTKVHCYFLDQNRIVRTSEGERNYHIFYQMLAGLNAEERAKLHLGKHTERTLNYLRSVGPPTERNAPKSEDVQRFQEWKTSLGVLGIPYLDVVKVLAAVILLGNVRFIESQCMEVEVEGVTELQAAASLLGVSETALKQGLTMRTYYVRNQSVRSRCDANSSNFTRDSLAKSLYCRTVATIVRRANSLKRLSSTSGTLSSDSTDSVHNQAETLSQHASTVGTAGSKASKSMTALNNAVRHATDGFIGILDMFGFEDVKPSHLEHLCINLCAETMQHFYNTHIFKACIESCREEGIQCDWEVDYVDNVPCIDLVSSLHTGLLSMLDVECSLRGTVESYVQKVRTQHKQHPRLIETSSTDLRSFAIQHYAGVVHYNATDFLETNRDVLADDLVAVFHKHRCSFGFASHLFSSELKILGAGGMEPCPRGISFRISPTSHTELLNGEEPVSTLTQDFHTRLDNLLRTLVHARPHFIRCIKINDHEEQEAFDRQVVSKQLRAFQVLETINLMANGYPHRMRFKAFNARYKLLAPLHQLARTDDRATDDCQRILECFVQSLDESERERLGHISISWALGKRHIFMSEGARQQLETMRVTTRNRAATLIQCTWRGWHQRRRWPLMCQGSGLRFQGTQESRHPNGLPINGIHPNVMGPAMNAHHLRGDHPPFPLDGNANNIIYRNGVMVAASGGASMVSLHNLQTQSGQGPHGQGLSSTDFVSPATCQGSPPAIPIPIPRSNVANNPSHPMINGRNGMTEHPVVPTLNTTSMATISLVNSSANNGMHTNGTTNSNAPCSGRPRPQPISGTPPPDAMDRCDPKLVQQTCDMFGLDMERPPPLPPSRSYTVAGNTKLGYPQTRVMKMTFPEEGTASDFRFLEGDAVVVVGASSRRGHLLVEHKNRTIHVPFQFLELKAPP